MNRDTCRHGRPECECNESRTLVCKHPYVSRAWIGYSGYCHCYECGNIVEDDGHESEEM